MGVEIQNALNVVVPRLGVFLRLFLDDRLAQRNADNAMQVMGDYTFAARQLAGVVGVGHQKFRRALGGIAQHRPRDGAVIGNTLAGLVAARRQTKLTICMAQENKPPFRASQSQRGFQQRIQNVVQHSASVQLACRRFPGRELAQKLLRRTGGRAGWTEDHVGRALHPEFNPIVAPQLAPVHPFSIDESAVPAALIDKVRPIGLADEVGVFARDPRVSHHQISVRTTANRKRKMVEHQGAAIATFHHHQDQGVAGRGVVRFAQPHASSAHQACLLRTSSWTECLSRLLKKVGFDMCVRGAPSGAPS